MCETVEALQAVLESRAPWAALTGAGVSSDSGIPTYRDHEGNWLGSNPILHEEFIQDEAKRRKYWSRSALGWPRVARAEPNATHAALTRLEAAGTVGGVITQNVDRLHQKSGSQKVIDLHGRLDQVRCLDCGQIVSRHHVQHWLETHNVIPPLKAAAVRPDGDASLPDAFIEQFQVPTCPDCNGVLKPDVVFFGGTVPKSTVAPCHALIDQAEGLLVIGSSLSVYSGFRFCRYCSQQNKPVVILNQGKTRADELCLRRFSTEPFTLLQQCADRMQQLCRRK
jgi:NAD-dependent SIR2 family protein deacetylase